jgi:putative tryptophan/tyrosine transport system substrate-binding protein
VAIEYRWAERRYDRLLSLAADLVGRKVDLILAADGLSVPAARNATSAIPIVFNSGYDPVAAGLVASLARPGGNLTGFSLMLAELTPKRLELISELVPRASVIALLVNPGNPGAERAIGDVQEATRAKGVQLAVLKAGTEGEIDAAFASLAQRQAGALIVSNDPAFFARRDQLAALAERHAVPAIYPLARVRRGRRSDQLWSEPHRYLSPGGRLRRKDPQRCQAGRSAGPAADDIRAGD